ncbi:DNA-binding transcriptional MerR regulator [Georgenia soli]|uniref:DNA-binding transcriptional MerR regulator n=1 Tax=Georgenia soli TaxID=638953 RepID=A0A2A9F391_9MICO|nr:MerR family transcriptional regulator [Georgenia soli]PFG45032.1 DNA-binding transcriptional MerR regulator [Georgenia soli]
MLSIGQFASITGLSVKALRHYDEKGVLAPAEVDPVTGYRRYLEGQVRAGAVVRALRDAGLPLPAVAIAVAHDGTGQDGPAAALEEHRQRVLAERAREDAALQNARAVLSALATPVEVSERRRSAQPYVARRLTVSMDDEQAVSERNAEAEFVRLFTHLQDAEMAPAGAFWTALREGGTPDTAELLCCWPTERRLPAGWGGDGTVVGVLPQRRELVATWRSDGGPLPEGAVHPAVVALFEAVASRGLELSRPEVRQTVVEDDGEGAFAVEIAVTIEAS